MMRQSAGHLLYCSYGYTPHDYRFIEAACQGGWKVSVMRFDGGKSQLDWRDLPEGAHRVSWIGDDAQLSDSSFSSFEFSFGLACQKVDPDLIQAGPLHNVANLVCSTKPKVPVLATSWGFDLLVESYASQQISESITSTLHASTEVLVDCETLRSIVLGRGIDPSRVEVLPWGVDLSVFTYSEVWSGGAKHSIVSLRSLENLYQVGILLEALSIVDSVLGDQIHATIGGDGNMKTELREKANNLGLRKSINWIGRVPESEVPRILAEASIYVSTSPIDGSSISLLQAMASGRVCVVADIPSNREWIEHGVSGLLFDSSNPRSLADSLLKIVERPDVLNELGRAARRKVEESADWTQRSLQYRNLLTKVALHSSG